MNPDGRGALFMPITPTANRMGLVANEWFRSPEWDEAARADFEAIASSTYRSRALASARLATLKLPASYSNVQQTTKMLNCS